MRTQEHAAKRVSVLAGLSLSPVAKAVRGLLRSRDNREQREAAAQHTRMTKARAASRMRIEPLEPRVEYSPMGATSRMQSDVAPARHCTIPAM